MTNPKRLAQIAVDIFTLAFAFIAAYLLRFDFALPAQAIKYASFQLPYIVALEYGMIVTAGAHRVVWRFVSASDIVTLARPLVAATVVLVIVRIAMPHLPLGQRIYLTVPFGVILINFFLATMVFMGVRISRRLLTERSDRLNISRPAKRRRMILIGAGKSGVQVAQEVTRRPDLGMDLVGFVDDDPMKLGTSVCGYRVLAKIADLRQVVVSKGVDDVVIAITEASKETVRDIVATCEKLSVSVKIIPGLYEIIGGHVNVSRIRDVSIEDLLGRDAVQLDTQAIGLFIEGKTIAVTGAGGSIGSELTRQVAEFNPGKLLLIERAENALFEIHRELIQSFPDLDIRPIIADVTVEARMRSVFTEHHCDAIIHAAAHKHVPMMEWNPSEAVRNNILGTKCVADLAAEFGVGHFVLISTDKAINPTSIMGASKRAAELYVQAMGANQKRTKFVSVRFGNVLGSAGSVVPIFKQQIEKGGPVMVTHPEMVRYFMTIPEAAQLVLQAATLGTGGEVFILDMGKPVKIVDLAYDLIRLSGLRPGEDIEVRFSGMRPGEKLFEELLTADENSDTTTHKKIFVGRVRVMPLDTLGPKFKSLEARLSDPNRDEIYNHLREIVPEFTGKASVPAPASANAIAEGSIAIPAQSLLLDLEKNVAEDLQLKPS